MTRIVISSARRRVAVAAAIAGCAALPAAAQGAALTPLQYRATEAAQVMLVPFDSPGKATVEQAANARKVCQVLVGLDPLLTAVARHCQRSVTTATRLSYRCSSVKGCTHLHRRARTALEAELKAGRALTTVVDRTVLHGSCHRALRVSAAALRTGKRWVERSRAVDRAARKGLRSKAYRTALRRERAAIATHRTTAGTHTSRLLALRGSCGSTVPPDANPGYGAPPPDRSPAYTGR